MSKGETVRLSCPTCDAVYEVPLGAIPEGGRDVQCSNCGTVWFQRSGEPPAPPSAAALASTTGPARKPPSGDEAPRPPLSEEGRRILVEEAEREKALRSGRRPEPETPQGPAAAIDSLLDEDRGHRPPPRRTPDPVPSAPEPVSPAPPPEPERTPGPGAAAGADRQQDAPPERASRRDRLPDISDIDSKLVPREGTASPYSDQGDGPQENRQSGFRLGFALALVIAAIALALYVQADRIGQSIPALDAPLDAYRDRVNDMRIALDGLARNAAAALEE